MNSLETNKLEPQIQDYIDFLNQTTQAAPNVIKKERILANLDKYGGAINTFLAYPDILVDLMTPGDSVFSLFFFTKNGIKRNGS